MTVSAIDQGPTRPTSESPSLGNRQAVRQLAARFAQEPELVLACLEGISNDDRGEAKVILEAARVAAAANPDYADLIYAVGRAAVVAGEYETAAIALDHAITINPTYKDALILDARVALRRGQPALAAVRLNAALAEGADYPDVHMLLGDVWTKQGDLPRARAAYERALELNAKLTPARTALAALEPINGSRRCHELPA